MIKQTPRANQPSKESGARLSRRSRLAEYHRTISANGRLPAFLLSVGLAVLAFGFLFTQDFLVKTVVVQGNSLAYADSIVESSGAINQPIFLLDTEEIARRVASHPAVEWSQVSAALPDRLIVRVHERVPVLVWQAGERAFLVDERGWVLAESDDPKLPRIIQLHGSPPAVGRQLPPLLIEAIQAVGNRLGQRLTTLEHDQSDGLTAYLSDGRVVILGSVDRIPVKLNVLDAALGLPEQWLQLDLREPERPYYH
jgi:cell division protein FtsQ